jgi:hypothetical protein
MRTKQVLINLRPQDRINQHSEFDENPETSDCEYSLSTPLTMTSDGVMSVRSAYVPITYKNVIQGYNDRFAIVLRPAVSTSDDDSVFVTVQIPVGQYDSSTDLASAINTELAKMAVAVSSGALSSTGGVAFSYSSTYTAKLLSSAMTCSVSNNAGTKEHLQFDMASNVAATDLDGGFQIVFGLLGSPVNPVANREAVKIMGFGLEKKQLNGSVYRYTPATPFNTTSVAQQTFSDSLVNTLLTPYIYVRCDLARQSIETRNKTTKSTDLICKIPVTSSGYGDVQFYEASNNPFYININENAIHNIRIVLTDSDGRPLVMGDNEHEISLVFEGKIN